MIENNATTSVPGGTPLPTTADYETALADMFATAQGAGECFLDVTARGLVLKVHGGPPASSGGLGVCCNLMRRMMIPGDADLTACHKMHSTLLMIRYRLPR